MHKCCNELCKLRQGGKYIFTILGHFSGSIALLPCVACAANDTNSSRPLFNYSSSFLLLFAAIDTSDKGEVATDATQSVGLCLYNKKSRDI